MFTQPKAIAGVALRLRDLPRGEAPHNTARETGARARPIAEIAWRWTRKRLGAH